MGGTSELTNLAHAGAHQNASVRDQHDLVGRTNQRGGDHTTVALALLNGDHPLGTATVPCVFDDAGALAKAVFSRREHALRFVLGHEHGDQLLAFLEHHASNTARLPTHRADIVLVESNGFAAVAEEHHIVLAVGQRSADEVVAFVEVDRNDARLAWVAEILQRRLLHRAE